jgi:cytoskeletal protein CcmA (bactofilin family)
MSVTRRSLAAAVAAAATLALAGASSASAQAAPAPVVCDGALSGVTVGDVTVPYNTSCTLTNVVVEGTITGELNSRTITLDRTAVSGDVVTAGRRLVATTAAVGGDVVATESRLGVVVSQSVVRGDLTAFAIQGELRIGSLESARYGNVIGGTLKVDTAFVDGVVARNVVAEDLLLTGNQAAVEVRRNVVRGALDCQDNVPDPVGGSNLAGSKLGQCSAL